MTYHPVLPAVSPTSPRRDRDGFTVIELLVALGVIGVLAAIAVAAFRAPASRLAAQDFQALLQEARTQAIKRNRPVNVALDLDAGTVSVRASEQSSNVSCTGDQVQIGQLDLAEYRGLEVSTTMPDLQMLWLPNGRAQRCNGGLMASSTTFRARDVAYAVDVSAAGQVRVVRP